jgi:hypothetical protein
MSLQSLNMLTYLDSTNEETYSFDSQDPIYLVVEFQSDSDETGFSLSFHKNTIEPIIQISYSPEDAPEETKELVASSLSDQATEALEQLKNVDEYPMEILAFISIFILTILLALIMACVTCCSTMRKN